MVPEVDVSENDITIVCCVPRLTPLVVPVLIVNESRDDP
jgi:hypothetical protein